jgi:hypothetical protein
LGGIFYLGATNSPIHLLAIDNAISHFPCQLVKMASQFFTGFAPGGVKSRLKKSK